MTPDPVTGDHVRRNREGWEHDSPAYQERNAAQLNRWDVLGWGVYDVPEDDVRALGDVGGLDVLEYGCGACQFGIKVAMCGARLTGLDFSHVQLRQGLANMAETGVGFPVVEADGERTPFADASFDLVFCDHGSRDALRAESGLRIGYSCLGPADSPGTRGGGRGSWKLTLSGDPGARIGVL